MQLPFAACGFRLLNQTQEELSVVFRVSETFPAPPEALKLPRWLKASRCVVPTVLRARTDAGADADAWRCGCCAVHCDVEPLSHL